MNQEFSEAKKRKEENVNSFVWKFKKEYTDNGPVQNEVKLIDCSLEELKNFYNICKRGMILLRIFQHHVIATIHVVVQNIYLVVHFSVFFHRKVINV